MLVIARTGNARLRCCVPRMRAIPAFTRRRSGVSAAACHIPGLGAGVGGTLPSIGGVRDDGGVSVDVVSSGTETTWSSDS